MIGRNSSIAPRFLRSNDQSEDTTGNPWEGWSSVTETHGQNPREYLDRIFSGDQFDLLETDKDSQFPGGFLQKYTIPADTVLQLLNLTLEGGYVGAQVYTERPRAIRSPIDIVLLHYPGSVCVGIRPGTPPQPSTPVSLNMSHYFPASNLIEQQLDQIFLAARQERFETGMGSQFSTNLQQLYEIDPYTVLQSLRERLARLEVCPEVLAEMLTWVSRQEPVDSAEKFLDIMSRGLDHPSSLVRDAAALGLAYFDEDVAIRFLKKAIENEQVRELREDLEDLVRSLETYAS